MMTAWRHLLFRRLGHDALPRVLHFLWSLNDDVHINYYKGIASYRRKTTVRKAVLDYGKRQELIRRCDIRPWRDVYHLIGLLTYAYR